jgi:hypothetical protein
MLNCIVLNIQKCQSTNKFIYFDGRYEKIWSLHACNYATIAP